MNKTLKVGILEGTDMVPIMANIYDLLKGFFQRTLKLPIEEVVVTGSFKDEVIKGLDVDVFMTGIPLEDIEMISDSYDCTVSIGMQSSLISANPAPFLRNNGSLYTINNSFLFVFLSQLMLVAVIKMLIDSIHEKRRLTKKKSSNNFIKKYVFNLWLRILNQMAQFAYSLLLKAIPNVPKMMSGRILLSGWLLSIQIINVFLACDLKSDLSNVAYQKINTFSDFFHGANKNAKLGYLMNSGEDKYLKQQMKHFGFRLEANQKIEFEKHTDLVDLDIFRDLNQRSLVLFYEDTIFKMVADMTLDYQSEKNAIFIGKDKLIKKIMVVSIKRVNTSRQFIDVIKKGASIMFEHRPVNYIMKQIETRLSCHTWETPQQDLFNVASLDDISLSLTILGVGYSLICVVILIEMTIVIAKPKKKTLYKNFSHRKF